MSVLKHKMLECINDDKNHFKFYEIKLEEIAGEFYVNVRHGRIGTFGRPLEKYRGPSQIVAERVMNEIYDEKMKKYEDVS